MNILGVILLILFWSAVLAFIPTTLYLLVKNPPLYRADRISSQGIFILSEEFHVEKSKKSRMRIIGMIYAACLVFFSCIYVFNQQQQVEGIKPFDVLSTLFVVFFWVSILSYLPIAIYLVLKNPWQYKEEGVCLTAVYIFYGACILIFSGIFAFHWLKSNHLLGSAGDISSSLLIIIFGAAVLSYLPILVYVYLRIARPYKQRPVHPNTIFVIYSLCFLLFSSIYLINWVSDRRAGVQYKSWAELLRFW